MTAHKFLEHSLIEDDRCNWEYFILDLVYLASSHPQFPDKRERWSYVAHNLGFPSPCTADDFLDGLDNLYKKLKTWSKTDRKTYWKYMDIIGDCFRVLVNDEDIMFKYKGNDVIIVPRQK